MTVVRSLAMPDFNHRYCARLKLTRDKLKIAKLKLIEEKLKVVRDHPLVWRVYGRPKMVLSPSRSHPRSTQTSAICS